MTTLTSLQHSFKSLQYAFCDSTSLNTWKKKWFSTAIYLQYPGILILSSNFIYKTLIHKAPSYLCSLLIANKIRNLRSSNLISLFVPKAHTNIGRFSFQFGATTRMSGERKTKTLDPCFVIHLQPFCTIASFWSLYLLLIYLAILLFYVQKTLGCIFMFLTCTSVICML